MLAELRAKSQNHDTVVYPKKYLDALREEIEETKAKIVSGEQPVFDNVDALFAKLEEL